MPNPSLTDSNRPISPAISSLNGPEDTGTDYPTPDQFQDNDAPFWVPAGLPRNRFAAKNFIESLGFAMEGMVFALKTQRNFRIDVLIGLGVIALGSVYHLRLWEWAPLVLVMGMVLFSEAMNTAIEFAVDMVTQGEFDMRAKIVKDVSAAACLLMALTAAGVGTLIFTPHIWLSVKQWFGL